MTASAQTTLLADVLAATMARHDLPGWTLRSSSIWCHVGPAEPITRIQGWKLHLSATPLSAPLVLAAAADVLLAARCPFKFAQDLDVVEELTSIRYDRAQAGKFVTVYPADDAQFHQLARDLCDATTALPGPRILTDRPYRRDSIVQYRFGAFRGVPTLTDDGSFEARVQAPDGRAEPDHRLAWFAPPAWAGPSGVDVVAEPAGERAASGAPLLDGRFEVVEAIRHSARGGVFRALDQQTGHDVVIKQARPHIGARRDGRDARDQLRHEAVALAALAPSTPAVVAQFEVGADIFLVEEFVRGRSLADHIADVLDPSDHQAVTRLALALVALLADVHGRGWVLRDLSSTNVMVDEDGPLVLIDPEYAARPGELVQRAVTPGFAPPEVLTSPIYSPAPDDSADRYALGALLVQLLLGAPPILLAEDGGAARGSHERIDRQLATAAPDRPLVARWRPLLVGLTDQDPHRRWTLTRAAEFLTGAEPAPTADPGTHTTDADRVIDDGITHLCATMNPDADWLWFADAFGSTTDPLNVQYGAAGVLAVLVRAALGGHGAAVDAVATAAAWVTQRLTSTPRVLPGLYFGRSGTAWALREAADLLDDDALRTAAERFALSIDLDAANPDVCHGIAGAGFGQLRMWQLSGRDAFLDRVRECAERLAVAACTRPDGVFWPVPDDADSQLAGAWHFGYAHGVAGVGAFLLAAAAATGEPRYLELAGAAGATLASAAERDERTGAITWRADRNRPGTNREMSLHWCSGASGVGSFLVRLARVRPDACYGELVRGAASAVHAGRWRVGTAACHGLAGDGQFLLDAAGLTGDARYREMAEDLATVLLSRHGVQGGRLLLPDESGLRVVAGYGTGSAGALDFLLRLRDGGPRSWAADHSDDADPATDTADPHRLPGATPHPVTVDLGRR